MRIFGGYTDINHPRVFLSDKLTDRLVQIMTTDARVSFEMSFTTAPDVPVPHLDVNADLGNFVYAVSKIAPGKSYMASGTTCSWAEYMRMWGEMNSVPAHYRQVTLDELITITPDREFGREVGDMFSYSTDPGYDGNDRDLLTAQDIREVIIYLLLIKLMLTGLFRRE